MLKKLDRGLLLAIITLMGLGLVQVYSSSYIFAIESYGNGLFFFQKQFIFSLLGILVLLAVVRCPFALIQKWGWILWVFGAIGVLLTLVPGIGVRVGGAVRWLNLPLGFRFEPVEILKIALCLLLATFAQKRFPLFGQYEISAKILMVFAPLLLLLKQPDFGSFTLCLCVSLVVVFVFGLRIKYLIYGLLVSAPAFYFLVMEVPYRRARVLAFLDPWSDPTQKGFQLIQSMLSFHSGGLFGTGLGQGQGKLFFLPEAHTDFTLAVLGEEMGFVGFFIVMLLYGFIVFRGLQIAVHSKNAFARALSISLTALFALSIVINMGVVLGLLPTKGLTLPFLSYGGSSLVAYCIMMGLLLNLERQTVQRR